MRRRASNRTGPRTQRVFRRRAASVALVALLAAAGCTPTAPRYTVVPTSPEAQARPAEAAPAVPTGDVKLDAFLAEFAAALDRKDWRAIARRLDAPTYADLHDAEVAGGATPAAAASALIADALGLATLAGTEAAPFSGLDRIRVVTIRDASEVNDGVVRVRGDVRLDDDTRLPLNAFVRTVAGRYRIVLSRA